MWRRYIHQRLEEIITLIIAMDLKAHRLNEIYILLLVSYMWGFMNFLWVHTEF